MDTSQSTDKEVKDRLKELSTLRKELSLLQKKVMGYSPLESPINVEVEINRIEKRIQELNKEIKLLASGQEYKTTQRRKTVYTTSKSSLFIFASLTTLITALVAIVTNLVSSQISEYLSQWFRSDLTLKIFTTVFLLILSIILVLLTTYYLQNESDEQDEKLIDEIKKTQQVVGNGKQIQAIEGDTNITGMEEQSK